MPQTDDQRMAHIIGGIAVPYDLSSSNMYPDMPMACLYDRRPFYKAFSGDERQFKSFDTRHATESEIAAAKVKMPPNRKERQLKRAIANKGKRKHEKGGRKK